ncbi:MAG: T9SS-dependent M6-like inactivated metalloprotease [Ignavibacteriaceae bacterium]
MFKKLFPFVVVILSLGSLSAQTFIGKLNPFPEKAGIKISSFPDTLNILAVMVEFQADKDAATSGTGKFGTIYSQNYGNTILDPLPHDVNYFDAHLEFVKNYFEKVSNGKLIIKYTVLPNIITVSQMMRNYSPASNSTDFSPLANFSKEVWAEADSMYPGFDFSKYQLFTIFHAGVGRDISLPGSLGTERDLPSIYLSPKALQNIYGSNFNGFPVDKNSFLIRNSLIMPETESREESILSGTVLFQVTINGLLAASVGSYLGLPDLFDTNTGLSAIGRFGLMDGQSIFAYNGAFPPEPSAWEKIFLGWATPVTISPGNYNINLATQVSASLSDTVILKVPINSTEYFLLENRQRDANHDGAIITYVLGGNTYTKTFYHDTTTFMNIETDLLKGVITNVDEFDWALPGQIDDTSNYGGGILIWHIDDNIINSNISSNSINANPNHRGVNLMEASGVPEIGQKFTDLLGNTIIGEGSYQDYWYANNSAVLYKNIFSKDSRPNSNTNSAANSLITISNFSTSSNKMNLKIAYGDSLIKPVFSKQLNLLSGNDNLNVIQKSSGVNFNLLSSGALNIIDSLGNVIKTIPNFSSFKTASISLNGIEYVAGAKDSLLNVYMDDGTNNFTGSVNVHNVISAPPVIYNASSSSSISLSSAEILVGTSNGYLKIFSFGSLPNNNPSLISVDSSSYSNISISQICADNNFYVFGGKRTPFPVNNSLIVPTYLIFDKSGISYNGDIGNLIQLALTKDAKGDETEIALLSGNIFDVFSGGKLLHKFQISSSDLINSFALADLKQDGGNYILYTNGNEIDAVNLQGASADYFPFVDPQGIGFTGTPVTADFYGDGKSEVIAATKDGRIFAIDGSTGKVVPGFPFTSGSQLASTPALFVENGILSIAAINQQNNFSAWNIGADAGKTFWSEENGNSLNSSFINAAQNQDYINQFFPVNRAYNYPNPVYGTETKIRYYVSEDSQIDIKIFDLAGDYVADLKDNARGGLDNETTWNVSNIQSGVYLAHIQATGVSGKTESNIIKIAVVK